MARAVTSQNVGGFAFQMKQVVVIDVYRGNTEDGTPSDLVYMTVKAKDGSEVKFGTDQVKPDQDDALFGAKVSITGSFRGRRYGKDQSLQTVGALAIAEPIA